MVWMLLVRVRWVCMWMRVSLAGMLVRMVVVVCVRECAEVRVVVCVVRMVVALRGAAR